MLLRYHSGIKQKAQGLRREGKTFGEMQERLRMRVPKSTLSEWCKKYKLTQRAGDYCGFIKK